MADTHITLDQSNPIPFRAHDNGDGSYGLAVSSAPSVLYDGTINAAATAAALIGSSQPCSEVLIQNDPSNATGNDVYLGNAASQSMRLRPGDSEIIPIGNVNLVYVKAVAGTPRCNWHARS